ncbi:MAG TPA: hypothetical protein VGQ97_01390 [Xanthobacteraceae bacterium]|nr:hypothetical protein [Xanthobacteraceae bacterium]
MDAPAREEALVYRYRPRLIGGEFELTLAPDALEWATGTRTGRLAYGDVKRVRVSFQPSNLMTRRCLCEIWPRSGGRLAVSSSSARSLLDSTDHGPEFRAFVTALVRKVGAAGGATRLEAGMAAWRWWPMMIITVAVLGGAFVLGVRASVTGETVFGLAVLVLSALFGWQMGSLIARNRPRTFSPDAIPPSVLP